MSLSTLIRNPPVTQTEAQLGHLLHWWAVLKMVRSGDLTCSQQPFHLLHLPPPRSILSGKLGDHTEASLSKPWLSPRLAAPELPPPFPDKILEYKQRAHRREERAWSHPRNSMLAELAGADQAGWPWPRSLFWKLSISLPELPLLYCSHCLFPYFLTPAWGDSQQQVWVTHSSLPGLERHDNKQQPTRSSLHPTHPTKYDVECSCRHSYTRFYRPQARHMWEGLAGRVRSANPPWLGAHSCRKWALLCLPGATNRCGSWGSGWTWGWSSGLFSNHFIWPTSGR